MQRPQFEKNTWIGRIGDDFTVESVQEVARALVKWMKGKELGTTLIGYDTRFGGKMFASALARTLEAGGIQSKVSTSYVTSAMLILSMVKHDIDIGIMITASDKGASFSGVKLKGISTQEDLNLVNSHLEAEDKNYSSPGSKAVMRHDIEEDYYKYITKKIDFDSIRKAGLFVVFDPMFGASQKIYDRLLPASVKIRAEFNPDFKGIIPKPNKENLHLLTGMAAGTEYVVLGFALDSDGEQLAVCDEAGKFIDPYELLKEEKNFPWRDGLFIAFSILEKMAKSGKKLSELV